MNCSDFESRLSDFIDGDITASVRKQFLRHKEDCPECDELLRDFKAAVVAIHSLPPKKTSPDFNQRLFERIHGLEEQSFWQKILGVMPGNIIPRYAVAMAFATLIILLGTRAMQDGNVIITESSRSALPPPALNVPHAPQQVVVPSTQEMFNMPVIAESDTQDTNRIVPVQERSYEGQIRYVRGQ